MPWPKVADARDAEARKARRVEEKCMVEGCWRCQLRGLGKLCETRDGEGGRGTCEKAREY
jgi:hypothetical protein